MPGVDDSGMQEAFPAATLAAHACRIALAENDSSRAEGERILHRVPRENLTAGFLRID